MKYATRKEVDKRHAKAEATARKWLAKGYSLKEVAKGIWNHYGYSTEVKDGEILIWGGYNGRNDEMFIFSRIS